jgi:hypothetical protein
MRYLLADLLQGVVLLLACLGLLSVIASAFVLWLFIRFTRNEPEDDYEGMQAALLGYAEQLAKKGSD